MSKDKNPRRVADNEAMAKTRMLRTSPQKLNLVAQMIRGKKVNKALTDLTFSKKRISDDVKKCLQSAIANAENNHNLDVDELVVAEAYGEGADFVLQPHVLDDDVDEAEELLAPMGGGERRPGPFRGDG